MGWSTDLFCNICFNHKTYNHKSEVENDLEEAKDLKKMAKDRLRELVFMTEPQKFCDQDETPQEFLSGELHNQFEALEEAIQDECRLYYLLDNWDACHNDKGQAIYGPKEVECDSAFLRGDFIKTDKDDNK